MTTVCYLRPGAVKFLRKALSQKFDVGMLELRNCISRMHWRVYNEISYDVFKYFVIEYGITSSQRALRDRVVSIKTRTELVAFAEEYQTTLYDALASIRLDENTHPSTVKAFNRLLEEYKPDVRALVWE